MSLHLFVIHFPVALLLLALVTDLAGMGLRDAQLREWSWRLLLLGAVMAFIAVGTGDGARMNAASSGALVAERLAAHEMWGGAGIWAIAGAALLRTLWRRREGLAFSILNLALLMAATGVVVAITLTGTLVRHGG